ncbi:DUF7268 family protein [Natronomonas sp. EA1]|uniref:DUF7268 family protein n=1 Tax=Natronomonas sp. EA1 TaxID=3421655 RepID=UPI003EBAFF5D
MDAAAGPRELAAAYLRPRTRIVAGGFLVGAVAGGLLPLVFLLAGWTPLRAVRFAFVLGTLAFGVGLLGWAGSAMAGRGFEQMQRHLETETDWTEADSRRAMARVGAFGGGVMATTGLLDVGLLTLL